MADVFVSADLLLLGWRWKMLREANTDAWRRFTDEGQLQANLRDPHMVRLLAVGETDDGAKRSSGNARILPAGGGADPRRPTLRQPTASG